MICANVASPCINSARPGAAGSTVAAANTGADATRSTTTTLAWRAIRRASVSAVSVTLSPVAGPSTVTLWAAGPDATSRSASASISSTVRAGAGCGSLMTGSYGAAGSGERLGATGDASAGSGGSLGAGSSTATVSMTGSRRRITGAAGAKARPTE